MAITHFRDGIAREGAFTETPGGTYLENLGARQLDALESIKRSTAQATALKMGRTAAAGRELGAVLDDMDRARRVNTAQKTTPAHSAQTLRARVVEQDDRAEAVRRVAVLDPQATGRALLDAEENQYRSICEQRQRHEQEVKGPEPGEATLNPLAPPAVDFYSEVARAKQSMAAGARRVYLDGPGPFSRALAVLIFVAVVLLAIGVGAALGLEWFIYILCLGVFLGKGAAAGFYQASHTLDEPALDDAIQEGLGLYSTPPGPSPLTGEYSLGMAAVDLERFLK